uniref:Ig-like domain-containing protein n=1 Tax=Poecilia latipinna TaxID=48699 RepID=A0A3B3TWX2_9TELE
INSNNNPWICPLLWLYLFSSKLVQFLLVSLPCSVRSLIFIILSRLEYVLLYKDNQLDPDAQHPSYRDRVDLLLNQLRKGDVSLLLKDTTTNDSGTYECRIDTEKHVGELISTISLQVSPPPPPGESLSLDQNQQLPGSDPDQMMMIFIISSFNC